MAVVALACALLWVTGAVAAAERTIELRGTIEPPRAGAYVSIQGALTPFSDKVLADSKGRFRFRNLVPGPYTVNVFLPGYGEVRRTVEVTESLADSRGRVEVAIPFTPPPASVAQTLEDRGTVSVRQLSIPDRARSEYEAAQRDLRRRDIDAAIRRLEDAVKRAPQFVLAWNNLGTIAYQTGRHADAEKYFRKALEHEPGAFLPVVNLGGLLLNLKRYDEALKLNLYAVEQQPHDALANSQLGINYFFLEEPDRALRYLKEAKRLDPAHFSQPQIYLAEIYARRGDLRAAIAELEEYIRLHPDAPETGRIRQKAEQLRAISR